MSIDLHMHSIYSDGDVTVDDCKEYSNTYDLFAVTDHDTLGIHKNTQHQNLISGVELTCRHDGDTVHLLVYTRNLSNEIFTLVEEYSEIRNRSIKNMAVEVAKHYKIPAPEVTCLEGGVYKTFNCFEYFASHGIDFKDLFQIKDWFETDKFSDLGATMDKFQGEGNLLIMAHPMGTEKLFSDGMIGRFDGIEFSSKKVNLPTIRDYMEKYPGKFITFGSDAHQLPVMQDWQTLLGPQFSRYKNKLLNFFS